MAPLPGSSDWHNASIIGIGQIPVVKASPNNLRELGAAAVRAAMKDAGLSEIDALFVGNMLSDELQGQKHVATLIASELGMVGIEALQVRAATATGAAALRMAYFAVASGQADTAVALGVEKMSSGNVTPILAKALDAETEIATGATLVSENARIMDMYLEHHKVPYEYFVNFALNAHKNALTNPFALYQKSVTRETVLNSRVISAPIRLYDGSPICDGAAAVILASASRARDVCSEPVKILASSVTTDWIRLSDRRNPLTLEASQKSARIAYQRAGIGPEHIDFFEVHDAFSIMSCLILEACGFAQEGRGWQLAEEGAIFRDGKVPIATLGGLKARGHPIGASPLYQTCEIVQQLTGRAGKNQLPDPRVAMLQSVGGTASTVLTHVFARDDWFR